MPLKEDTAKMAALDPDDQLVFIQWEENKSITKAAKTKDFRKYQRTIQRRRNARVRQVEDIRKQQALLAQKLLAENPGRKRLAA